MFLAALDASIVNANYARIATDFKALDLAQWITTAYYLASSSCQPLYGKLSDVVGRKPMIIVSYTLFSCGCLLCGLAQNMPQFIAARVVQGCGGAGIGTLITVLLSDLIPLKERAPWQGYLNIINTCGLSLGAPIGGLFADTIGWRWTFYCQVPLTSLAVLSVVFFLRVPRRNDKVGATDKLRRIDFLGALLLVLTVVSLLLGLDRASAVGWANPACFVPLALTPVFLLAFVLTERHLAIEPIIPGVIIRARTPLSVYFSNFFGYGSWSAVMFFVPLFYQAVEDNVSSTQAGIRLLPAIFSVIIGNVLGGHLIKRWGRYYGMLMVSTLMMTLAMVPILIASSWTEQALPLISVGIAINSFFFGGLAIVSLIALISSVLATDQATATATMFLSRSLGSAMATSLGGSLLQYALQTHLQEALRGRQDGMDPDRIVKGVSESLEFIKGLEPGLRSVVRQGYAKAIQAVMLAVTGGFAACWVSGWWVVEKKIA